MHPLSAIAAACAIADPAGERATWGIVSHLAVAAMAYRLSPSEAWSSAEVRQAVDDIVDALSKLDVAAEALARAKLACGAPRNVNEQRLHEAANAVLTEISWGRPVPRQWDPTAYENPAAGRFRVSAERIKAAVAAAGVEQLRQSTRPRNAALDVAIEQLSVEYELLSGRPATAATNSAMPAYRPGFVLFIEAIWPAFSDHGSPPTAHQIAASLSRARSGSAPHV